MLIQTACSVAIYCQRCGHIHVQDIPVFTGRSLALHCSSCGHEMAEVSVRPRLGMAIELTCGACGSRNERHYSVHQLKNLTFEKLYCAEDHFELGYVGTHQELQDFLSFNEAAYDALYPEEQGLLERQQMLLEALNRLHDFVAAGELACDCGSRQIMATLQGDNILLECGHCGGYAQIPVRCTADLKRLQPGRASAIVWKHAPFLDAREK